jgi:phytoene dehydrogenase-like protein
MEKVECVVIGAGVIGLAVARRLAQSGREVIVLEAAEGIGTVTSSRNSEVIHAGIYYRADSLMARMCVSGKQALYRYCRDQGIAHRNCGKLIVATTPKESEKLQSIRAHAEANGVADLQVLTGDAARALEPAPICWRCAATPKTRALPLRSTPRYSAHAHVPAASRLTPAEPLRCRWSAGFWSMPQDLAPRRLRAASAACRSK